jgi:predicted DCC family thiol-disulfide oxidoreductase YuxK
MEMGERTLVFYDGECGFCNRVVGFILKNEKDQRIFFAALHSDFAKNFLAQKTDKIDPNTFYFFDGKVLYDKSTAALKLLRHLKWYWHLLGIFWIFPKFLRDWGYHQIASRRHYLASQSCFLPDVDQRKRFLG